MAVDRKQQMKEITERLEQGVKDIFTSEMYTTYLRTMAFSALRQTHGMRFCWSSGKIIQRTSMHARIFS